MNPNPFVLAIAALSLVPASTVAGAQAAPERTVKGAPYCAESVHETVQWLADPGGAGGNRIVRQQVSRLCRDSEGRTRQEIERGGVKRVFLRDPVAGESWMLDTSRKTATRLAIRTRQIGWTSHGGWSETDQAAWRDYAERMRDWARQLGERVRTGHSAAPPVAPTPPGPPPAHPTAVPPAAPAPTAVLISRGDDGNVSVRSGESEVTLLRLGQEAQASWAMALGDASAPVMLNSLNLAPRGPGQVSALPPRDIEGLRVNGERTVWPIEAGRFGNEKPFQIVREVWTSPDLMLTVQSRDFDPRSCETLYRLRNVQRSEPDAALFKVPADYRQIGRIEERMHERREERREPGRG